MREIERPDRMLAIETSGETFSLALAENGKVISEVFWHSGLKHSERLLPTLNWLIAGAGWEFDSLARIAVTVGPGSFTGIRVGLACARILAQFLRIPLIGLPTLDLLACSVPKGPYRVLPAIDALRDEVYVGSGKKITIISVEKLIKDVRTSKKPVMLVGNAVVRYGERIRAAARGRVLCAPDSLNYPRAGVLALASDKKKGIRFDRVHPVYIRRSWAEEKAVR